MLRANKNRPHLPRRCRRGLTLAELLVATTIMLLIATAMAMLAMTVHSTNDYCRGQLDCAQQARIALQRIKRAMDTAIANEQFPGCLVVTEQAGAQELPQTLVVWSPTTTTSPGTRLPYVNEIVVFAPNPAQPGTLLEIRSPSDASTVPAVTDTSGWRTLTDQLKTSQATDKIALTDHLRTAPLAGAWGSNLTATQLRGVVRFRQVMAPSASEWSEYRGGTRTWQNIDWPLDSYRSTSGTRTVACQVELQLVAGNMESAASTALPFFGSASLSYELPR